METNFIIRFSPESKSDYNYDIIVETEREKFVVPIVAVGKRAMIGIYICDIRLSRLIGLWQLPCKVYYRKASHYSKFG